MAARDARAQSSATQRPMPNVLLLVDTSGSMERMPDNSLPSANIGVSGGLNNACNPGVETNPNRWGMLLQALTGNMQPFYSCVAQDRSSAAFKNEFKIAGTAPYDATYFLPYHRPLTGAAASDTVCALGPSRLPGATTGTTGVGPGALGYATAAGLGGDVRDFPDDALVSAKWSYMQSQYTTDLALPANLGANACVFEQAPDGQLDAARDYVRFALMTFDNDEDAGVGVNGGAWPPQGEVQSGTGQPFLGQWSYRRDSTNPDYALGTLISGAADGLPLNCAPPRLPFEVGARHWGAPPWEGRMVPFSADDASLLDIQRTNDQIQKVLLATRPYGATPIDGMLDDARDYLWYNSDGPKTDPNIATAGCREQFIILLTDGAPNLNLRPSCEGTGGICPFPSKAAQTAAALYANASNRVTTFVIGFSVNGSSPTGGDGFPAPYNTPGQNNCKAWYTGVGGTPAAMAAACSPAPPIGSTAEACCLLNEIAYQGSGGASAPTSAPATGPFFAESQSDIVLAFGRILASIMKTVATRTVPAYTPAVYSSTGCGTGATTAQFLGSFIPNAQRPWSGEILRERSVCSGTPLKATPADPSVAAGDSMSVNLATQTDAKRLFVSFVPKKHTTALAAPLNEVIDAASSVRPFYSAPNPTPVSDGIPANPNGETAGTEVSGSGYAIRNTTDLRLAMEVDKSTCKRGRAPSTSGTGTVQIPALDLDDGSACKDVVVGFTTGYAGTLNQTGTVAGGTTATYNFNVRCPATGGSPGSGHCSVSNAACDVANPTACAAIPGQVCVPDCAPLGAIFRANPVVNGPPDGLLRDAGYQAFQAQRAKRKPVLFAATTDGILHAFKAIETNTSATHELWSFIPPAVLPRLASNYPSGNQILLDGTPVVRDTVWDRAPTDLDSGGTPGSKWHTTLVAGLGAGGGGYYAVNVTDSDCNANPDSLTDECRETTTSTGYEAPSPGNLDEAGRADYNGTSPAKRGPHFLWQLTDLPKSGTSDPARVVRRSRSGTDMVSLFGRTTGTPAIATVQLKIDSTDHQVGVAILPGGVDGLPYPGESCDRIGPSTLYANDPARTPRSKVRKWAKNCTGTDSAVPGRGVTIVRLDTGQIIRHFGRQSDVPETIWNAGVVTTAPFDSPVIGTPVVYPQTLGAVAQKIFIGDADGTIWRIDVTDTDPSKWNVMLFADLIPNTASAAESQPVQISPIISLAPAGALVLNAATGDQESITYKAGEKNYVWSITEERPTTSEPPIAKTQWVETLDDGERVTGPMTVFDRTLYFATFAPRNPASSSGQCDNAGVAKLWGVNYMVADGGIANSGGAPLWCSSVDTSGVCAGTLTKNEAVTGALAGYVIPGVTLRATQACSSIEDVGEGTGLTGFSSLTPSEFHLSYGVSKARAPSSGSGLPPAAMTNSIKRPLPRIATTVNAWALVVD